VKVEEDEDVSVTIIGSHGISNIQEMFLGSVAEKVIRKAKRPVFVVKR
jgi:nucleotide-binding universal stress UspA family protein